GQHYVKQRRTPNDASRRAPPRFSQPLQGRRSRLRYFGISRLLRQFTEQLPRLRCSESFQHLDRPQQQTLLRILRRSIEPTQEILDAPRHLDGRLLFQNLRQRSFRQPAEFSQLFARALARLEIFVVEFSDQPGQLFRVHPWLDGELVLEQAFSL